MRNNNGRLRDDLTTYLHGKWEGIGRSFSKSCQKNCHKARKNELGVQSSEWMTEIMKILILKSIGGISQLGSFKSTGEGEAGSEMLPYNWLTLVSMPFQRQWIKGFLVCFWYPYIPICRLNGDIQSNWHPGNRFFKNTYRNFGSIKKIDDVNKLDNKSFGVGLVR